jgi:hypothetical protein
MRDPVQPADAKNNDGQPTRNHGGSSAMRKALIVLAPLILLSGCVGQGDDDEPIRLNGKDTKIEKLIQSRYAECLSKLDIKSVKWTVDNLYSGYSTINSAALTWSAVSSDGETLTIPTSESVTTLKTVDC